MSDLSKPVYPLSDGLNQPNYGISLREHFAGLMMQAQFIHHGAKGDYSWNENEAAKEAVSCADTLLAELERNTQPPEVK
tara:strand:- start:5740 stop:5976 length:237 start_codon:yes stop_codon:yes gene_type:complete